jgi:hypothetical protein
MAGKFDHLGPPQIALAGLRLWVHGREFPDHHDFWDGNWLRVTAHCGDRGAEVTAMGSFIHLSEMSRWHEALKEMNETVSGEAQLCGSYEKNLIVKLKMEKTGHLSIEVEITPDPMTQRHSFWFESDQTYLSELLTQCGSLLSEYPLRNASPAVGVQG